MKRREFMTLLGGAAAAWPFPAHPQQAPMPVVGFLSSASPELYAGRLRAFLQGLSETGYIEGRNVTIEYRWARGEVVALPGMAADLVRRRVAVIATIAGAPAALAAKSATSTIPVVFQVIADPVESGLVASMSHPGGNLTGITQVNLELASKRLELLHELLPTASVMALLVNPTNPRIAEPMLKKLQDAAHSLGLTLRVVRTSRSRDLEQAFIAWTHMGVGALVIGLEDTFIDPGQLGALMLRYKVPAIHQYREFAAAGGLMSYGVSATDPSRQAGVYVGRILKGEKPADLPVQQATKVELVVNLKTAKVLGINVPPTLLTRADEVID